MKLHRSELSPQFVDQFLKTVQLTEEEFETVLSCYTSEYIPRKVFYLRAGQVCRQIAYLNKGCVRNFTLDAKGREHILFFSFEDWMLGDLESIYTGGPGTLFIQAMEDCELLCISVEDMDKMEEQFPRLKQWHRAKQQKAHYSLMKRLSEVKTLSPEERYVELVQKHPQIFQRIH